MRQAEVRLYKFTVCECLPKVASFAPGTVENGSAQGMGEQRFDNDSCATGQLRFPFSVGRVRAITEIDES
jgi:hypothetical protein